jgi:hypothetical protein
MRRGVDLLSLRSDNSWVPRRYGPRTRDDGLPLCHFAQVPREAAMLDILESDREGNSHERRLDSSRACCIWGDREIDRMVLRTRLAIRSPTRQPSLACQPTFLSDDQATTITNPVLAPRRCMRRRSDLRSMNVRSLTTLRLPARRQRSAERWAICLDCQRSVVR